MILHDDFKTLMLNTVAARRLRAEAPHAETMLRAALAADNVTGDPSWDHFLTFIQATIEDARTLKAAAEAALIDWRVIDHNAMLLHKIGVAVMAERIRTLEAVVSLPKDLKAHGEKARSILDRIKDGDAISSSKTAA